jgi:hypothetical protein
MGDMATVWSVKLALAPLAVAEVAVVLLVVTPAGLSAADEVAPAVVPTSGCCAGLGFTAAPVWSVWPELVVGAAWLAAAGGGAAVDEGSELVVWA